MDKFNCFLIKWAFYYLGYNYQNKLTLDISFFKKYIGPHLLAKTSTISTQEKFFHQPILLQLIIFT